ncbi:MAG: DUF456 domain-containing protein [Candidatus Kuenenia stuttgartiensis]|nr:DUF456 domain-containing protein [Candidatus Kuenenia stuttgartiensis]
MNIRKNKKVHKELGIVRKNIKRASSLAGTTAGAIIGTILGGQMFGAIAGSVTGEVVKNTLGELAERWLAPKQAERIGTASELIINRIYERQKNGEGVRDDGFFENNGARSNAEELFEGVLIRCSTEYEEKKIPYIANIFHNTAFDISLNSANANYILSTANRLTFRQLALVAIVGQNQNNQRGLRIQGNRENFEQLMTEDLHFILQDFRALADYGLIRSENRMDMNSYIDFPPGTLILTEMGQRFFNTTGLNSMPDDDFTFENELK